MGAEVETTRFDLSLTAVPHDGGVGGALEYSTDLFDRSTVRRMLGHLERVLEQVAADADVRLSRLELLSAEERGLVLDAWNRTDGGVSARTGASTSCSRRRRRARPDAVAVVFEDAVAHLRGAEPAGEPARAPPAGAGRGPGRAGGDLRGARPGDGGGAPGRAEGGRRLRAAGPGATRRSGCAYMLDDSAPAAGAHAALRCAGSRRCTRACEVPVIDAGRRGVGGGAGDRTRRAARSRRRTWRT